MIKSSRALSSTTSATSYNQVKDLQWFTKTGKRGGPLILTQLENEFGQNGFSDHPRWSENIVWTDLISGTWNTYVSSSSSWGRVGSRPCCSLATPPLSPSTGAMSTTSWWRSTSSGRRSRRSRPWEPWGQTLQCWWASSGPAGLTSGLRSSTTSCRTSLLPRFLLRSLQGMPASTSTCISPENIN